MRQRNFKKACAVSAFKPRPIHCAILLALGSGLHLPAAAQSYVNYDGSRTADYAAAVATWADAAEFKLDWGLGAMNAQYAYALGYSGAGVKVGAVDSGLRLTHQEFADQSLRSVTAVGVAGSYLNDGSQRTPRRPNSRRQDGRTWTAGDAFEVPGAYDPAINDNHGNHVSGTIAAAKDGLGMMGVAFGSDYYITNTNGTDSSIYGANMDYNYFRQAYGNLAAAGVRVINSSWGSPFEMDDYDSVDGLVTPYRVLQGAGKKSWLDAAADVARETGVIHVFAAGNAGTDNVNVRSALPYFRPELESNWVTVTGLTQTLDTQFNKCGVAKYWCVAAPSSSITSLDGEAGDAEYRNSSGTSMAAPHVTGAMGVLMGRYPALGNDEIRTILLTTARQPNGTAGIPTDVPNATFGWGVPDLQIAMNGPGQLLGQFNASISAGATDTWSNNISETALQARKIEEAAEVAAWSATEKAAMQQRIDALPTADAMLAGIANAKALLQAAIDKNTPTGYAGSSARNAAVSDVRNDPIGAVLLAMYEASHPAWTNTNFRRTSTAEDFADFVNGLSDAELAAAALAAVQAQLRTELDVRQARLDVLSAKTEADYVGKLLKTGAGTLVLTGDNSYSGGTDLKEGTLGVGSSTALGTGALAVFNGSALQAHADGLNLANAVTLDGNATIDTQGYGQTLSGAITDGEGVGGLLKAGTGTLTLSGANTYTGPSGVIEGALRAGSATAFSPRSAFVVTSGAQLELADFSQTIGSLAGGGKVLLGSATLTTGADNLSTVYSGEISGGGGLAKSGIGDFTLTGANTYSGATVLAAGRLQAGAHNTLSPASSVTVQAGTTLDLAGYNQKVAGMTNAGTVSLPGVGGSGTTLAVSGPWVGQGGVLRLGTVGPATAPGDRVLLSGADAVASGSTLVQIGSVPSLGAPTSGKGLPVVGTENGARVEGEAFELAGGHLDGGAFRYRLKNSAEGSYLTSSNAQGQPSYRDEVVLYAALPNQLRQADLAMLGNLRLRIGYDDAQQSAAPSLAGGDRRAWGRFVSTDLDIQQGGPAAPSSQTQLHGFQTGTDLLASPNWRAGVYVGQLDGEAKVRGFAGGVADVLVGTNDLRNRYAGLYGTWRSDGGLYADAVLQYGRLGYTPQQLSGAGANGKGRSLLASIELGQPLALGASGWQIEPQLQVVHHRQELDDGHIAGALVQQSPGNGWMMRAGVLFKGSVATGAGTLQPYGRFNVYHRSGGADVARFVTPAAAADVSSPTGGTSTELAAGATLALSQATSLYGELGKQWSSGGAAKVSSSVNGSLGVRVRW